MTEPDVQPRCSLCGNDCSFDTRTDWRLVGHLIAWPGLVLLPLLCVRLMDYVTDLRVAIKFGILIGLFLWILPVLFCFTKGPLWVCTACGACFPARKVEPGKQDDHNENQQ